MADEYVELVESDDDFNEFDDADVSDYVGYGEQEEDLSEDGAIAAQMDASDETSSPFLEPDFPEVTEAEDGEAVEIAESDGDDEDEFDVIGDDGVTEFGAMSEDEDLSEDDAVAAQMDTSEEDVIELDYDSPENPDTIECDCICAVKTGDRVMVQLVNGEPTVIGVVGWGDALQSDVDSAKGSAEEAKGYAKNAHEAAVAAQEDADAAKTSAEAAEISASAAITQASIAESSASNALTQAGIASTSAANAGRAAALAQAALNTMGDYDWDSEDFNQNASLFYKDELGAHIVDARGADGTYRTDINSEGMEVTEVATGDKVASLGAAGAIIGKDKSTHTTITDNMFSVTGSNGYPTFQAENGTVITGNPYSDHVAIDSQTLAFYKQDGALVSYPVRSTYDNSAASAAYAAVINSDAYAESDRAIKFQLTATVSLNYYSSGRDVLKEFNKLVVVIDGVPVRISATIPAPYVWKNNTGTVIGNWTVTWTFETSSMSEISISGANQDGPLIGFGERKVIGPYVSMSAEFYEQNARRTFAVYADGSMETSFLDVSGSIKATNSIRIDGNVSFDPVDGLGTVDDSVEPFDAFIADKDGIRVSNGNGVAFNADSDGNVTASGNVSAGGFSVGGNPLLKVVTVADSERSVGASTATSWIATIPSIDGYKPIGLVGFTNAGTASTSMIPIRHYIYSDTGLYFSVRNASSSATSNLVYTYYVLYASNGVV